MSEKKIYFPELDGLRFFAFLVVFLHHAPELSFLSNVLILSKPILTFPHTYGWLGVDLFLCLSAFLFTKLLFAEYQADGSIKVKNFYIRRALRIWPLYFLFIAAMFLYDLQSLGANALLTQRGLGLATFTDNIFSAFMGYAIVSNSAHLWTISYEEQFYAVIPWLLQAVFKMNLRTKLFLAAGVFLFFSSIRAALIYFQVSHPAIWVLPVTHFESVLGGLVVGLIPESSARKTPNWLWMFLGLAALLGVCWLPNVDHIGWMLMLSYPLIGLGMSLILFSVVKEGAWGMKKLFSFKWLAYFGKISYGLYVYHLLALTLSVEFVNWLGISTKHSLKYPISVSIIAFIMTLAIAAVSYELLEKPFLRLKEHFTSIRSRPI